MRLCLAYPGNPRCYIEGESPRLSEGHTVCTRPQSSPRQKVLDRKAPSTHDLSRVGQRGPPAPLRSNRGGHSASHTEFPSH